MTQKFSLSQQLEEVDRELELRGRVYPMEVSKGRMRTSVADYHIKRMNAVRDTLAWLQANEAKIKEGLANGFNPKTSDDAAAGNAASVNID